MQKKKVLFVVHQLNYGGVQKSLISALNAIDYDENEVTLYIRKNRINLIDDVNPNVKNIIINDDSTHYYRKPYVIWLMICEFLCQLFNKMEKKEKLHQKLVEYINESQMRYEKKHYFDTTTVYDVAVSYVQGYTTQFVANYLNAKKKIMFYHASVNENYNVHKRTLPHFDKIIGVNKLIANFLGEAYPEIESKIDYLENYMDYEEIKQKSSEYEIEGDGDKLKLCSCGRFVPVKGFDLALDAANCLKKQGIAFQWYFVGDGPERQNLETRIKHYNLESDVIITGMKHNPYPYMANCDIYVQPSYEEAQPLTLIEAMSLCRPIVTTATVGGRSLIKNNRTGLIADFNKESLCEEVMRLKEDKILRNTLISNLALIDYSERERQYKERWRTLLKGE